MNKLLLIAVFITLTSQPAVCQNGTDSMKAVSSSVLLQPVTFSWDSRDLSDVLDKLAAAYFLRFSYAPDKLEGIITKKNQVTNQPLYLALEQILAGTDLSYITVGKIIAIIKKDTIIEDISTDQDSLPSSSGYTRKVDYYIYTPNNYRQSLPPDLRRKLYRLYKEELRLAEPGPKISGDSARKEKMISPINKSKYYVSFSLGFGSFGFKQTSNSNLPWKQDLNYEYSSKVKLKPTFTGGYIYRNIIFGTGISFETITLNSSTNQIIKRGSNNNQANPNSDKEDLVLNNSYSEKFSVIQIPFIFNYFRSWNKLFASAGPALKLNFIKAVLEENKFQKYISEEAKALNFTEESKKMLISSALQAKAGYKFTQRLVLSGGAEYNIYFNKILQNSFYSLQPRSLFFEISATCLLDDFSLKRKK